MIVLTSYTPLDSPGGVPKFNRDLMSAFPSGSCVHYSWWDVCRETGWDPHAQVLPEWEKAVALNRWLIQTEKVTEKDVVITDSFWGRGLEDHVPMLVSHQHGNWGHITKDDRDAGKQPEFPFHEAVQREYRRHLLRKGFKLTAVSLFIARQMMLQWGFPSTVINNGVDTDVWKPAVDKSPRKYPLVIHFTTTANKGLDHIELLKDKLDVDVWLLDEAAQKLGVSKPEALAQADMVVHPSAHEGNSMAVLESLACGVPVLGYDVGLLYQAATEGLACGDIGTVLPLTWRSPERFLIAADELLEHVFYGDAIRRKAREFALRFSLTEFRKNWVEYLTGEFGDNVPR